MPERIQHCIDPVTGERKQIRVTPLTDVLNKGRGNAIKGAVNTPAPQEKKLNAKSS